MKIVKLFLLWTEAILNVAKHQLRNRPVPLQQSRWTMGNYHDIPQSIAMLDVDLDIEVECWFGLSWSQIKMDMAR